MSQKNENADKSVKVISDAREQEILAIFQTLHGKVLTALQETDIATLFEKEWAKCGPEDYKKLHQQSRALLETLRTDRTTKRVASIFEGVKGVVATHMEAARARKAEYDADLAATPERIRKLVAPFPTSFKVPMSEVRACFPKDATDTQVFADLKFMGYQVTEMTAKGSVIVTFVPAPKPEVAPAPTEAPASTEAPKGETADLAAAAE